MGAGSGPGVTGQTPALAEHGRRESAPGMTQDTLMQAPTMGAGSGPGMTEDKPTLARA